MNEDEKTLFFEELYETYYDVLVLRCKRFAAYQPELQALAEDCVQDVFLKAITDYQRLSVHPDIAGWLFRACLNRMRNISHTQWVRSQKHAFSIDEQVSPEIADVVNAFQRFDTNVEYGECLSRIYSLLLDDERAVFDDYFLNRMPAKSIAQQHGTTQGAVKSTIYRIRKKIKNNFPFPLQILFFVSCLFHK